MAVYDWKLDNGEVISLLTIDELHQLDANETIVSITGEKRNYSDPKLGPPDEDTRFGYTAWGLPKDRRDALFLVKL